MRASGIFSVFGSETFASSPSPSAEGAGTIMRFSGVRIAFFSLLWAIPKSRKDYASLPVF